MKITYQKEWLMMEKRVEMLVELMKLLELMTLWWLPMEMKEEEDEARLEKWWWLPWWR